ncbi:MAG: hypothetical protein HYU29_01965 [Chloroflexi bacterium]|nr:hypothetical protein [Chloroflexota bacterium]
MKNIVIVLGILGGIVLALGISSIGAAKLNLPGYAQLFAGLVVFLVIVVCIVFVIYGLRKD